MVSLETINSMIDNYKIEYEKMNKYRQTIENAIEDIDFIEINTMSYEEIKKAINMLKFYTKKETMAKLIEIKDRKKVELYPEITSVHYYPEIKEMKWLSSEEQIDLDKRLKERRISNFERYVDEKSIEFLLNKKILEKRYVFKCMHDSWDCGEEVVTEEYLNGLKEYWEKEERNETTEEEDKQYHYGCITIPCAYEKEEEITNLEEFEDNLCYINYVIIKKPDLTLDRL